MGRVMGMNNVRPATEIPGYEKRSHYSARTRFVRTKKAVPTRTPRRTLTSKHRGLTRRQRTILVFNKV